MAATVDTLQQIKQVLQDLQQQVEDLADQDRTPVPEDASPPPPPPAEPEPEAAEVSDAPAAISILRAGMADIAASSDAGQITRAFVRLASRTGLRLLLLKRWRTGLQVLQCEGVSMPEEACKKRRDGRAPIPLPDNDLFQVIGKDGCLYSGPVPVKHFPLDLTLLLGRGSKDRQIVILPLPVRGHWSTFLYLDADRVTEKALALAEILGQQALARLKLMATGQAGEGREVAAILKEELVRRQKSQAQRAESASWPKDDPSLRPPDPVPDGEAKAAVTEADAAPSGGMTAVSSGPEPDAYGAGTEMVEQDATTEEAGESCGSGATLTPEMIVRHSGELPALPRAACHILAVIDDPRTTATRLEKAIAMDQALTAKVLRIANSPFYGAVRDIKTVSEAIVRLGFITIRNWTLVAATKSIFLTPGTGMLFRQIWKQSVLSAMASQLVAQAVHYREPEAVFLGGLMQNIGQLVLARAEPEIFHQVVDESSSGHLPYHVVERRLLGFDHGALGALLIREWNLSRELEEAVRIHHRLSEDSSEKRLAAMIALGEEIAACTGSETTNDKNIWANSVPAQILDISDEQYAELMDRAHHLSIDPQFFA